MPTVEVHIRPAMPSEAPLLSTIAVRSKAHWNYPQEWLDTWEDDLSVDPDLCDGETVWLAELNGTIVGFGALLPGGDTATLDDLWIDPDYLGQGIGKQMFIHLRDLAQQHGARRITIEAEPNAVGFYSRMGATVIGKVHSESIPGRVLPLMELDLTSPENTTISTA